MLVWMRARTPMLSILDKKRRKDKTKRHEKMPWFVMDRGS